MLEKISIASVAMVFVVLMTVTVRQLGAPPRQPSGVDRLRVAEPAKPLPAGVLPVAGRPTLINFWLTGCAPCLRDATSLNGLAERLAGQGVGVLLMSEDGEGDQAMRAVLDDKGLDRLLTTADGGKATAKALGVVGLPTTILVDAKGFEVARIEGEADWSAADLEARVTALLGAAR
ncbi:MAG: TlpA family protein disulfide reductase [Alphaproteobacteria bacterium]|nr:TlpA family protein disulfide reductase [Alphaproteobacteria bacterium]